MPPKAGEWPSNGPDFTYRQGGAPEAAFAVICFTVGCLLFMVGLTILQTEAPFHLPVSLAVLAVGALLSTFGVSGSLSVEERSISIKLALFGLVLGLLPYWIYLGLTGMAINASLILMALSNAGAIALRHKR